MRKIISLGLLALIFSLISGQALAGKVDVCEEKKQELTELGLYGLCNAYWTARNENARDRILENYLELAELVGGPWMPGLEPPSPPPAPPPSWECPCWTADSGRLDLAVGPVRCDILDNGVAAFYADTAYTVVFADPFIPELLPAACYFDYGEDPTYEYEGLSPEELNACETDVVEILIAEDFEFIPCATEY